MTPKVADIDLKALILTYEHQVTQMSLRSAAPFPKEVVACLKELAGYRRLTDGTGHVIGHPSNCRVNNGMDMSCNCGVGAMSEQTALSTDLVNRLRQRLITVPKPGSEPRDPYPNEWLTSSIGGQHKAGDSAGLQYLPSLTFGGVQSKPKIQEHVYTVEPLCEEAAKEIEKLRAALETLWPGLVLDLRYAADDDDKDAMRARIQTVEEALS